MVVQMIKLTGFLLLCSMTVAHAGKAEVSEACQGDYMTHCSSFEPFSAPCKACMRRAGLARRLSAGCLKALNANGYVSSRDKARYTMGKRKLLSQ